MTVTAPALRHAVTAIRTPKCEDCVHCRLATHYGEDHNAQVHFAICQQLDSGFGWRHWQFASDVRDDASLCGPSGRWFQAKED